MSPVEIARLRMRGLLLWGSPHGSAEDVVHRLGAIQAQEYLPAKWNLGQRSETSTDVDVERALTEGQIVRTHVLRPTWHFVAARDLRWILNVSGPRVRARNALVENRWSLDAKTVAKAITLIAKSLEGRRHLAREEIAVFLLKHGRITASGERLAYIIMSAELNGVVCSGPRRGKQHTYALLDERIPTEPEGAAEALLARLARCYFTTRGPATVRDFAAWATLNAKDAKAALSSIQSELEPITIGRDTV